MGVTFDSEDKVVLVSVNVWHFKSLEAPFEEWPFKAGDKMGDIRRWFEQHRFAVNDFGSGSLSYCLHVLPHCVVTCFPCDGGEYVPEDLRKICLVTTALEMKQLGLD